jgi:hypothetical protein
MSHQSPANEEQAFKGKRSDWRLDDGWSYIRRCARLLYVFRDTNSMQPQWNRVCAFFFKARIWLTLIKWTAEWMNGRTGFIGKFFDPKYDRLPTTAYIPVLKLT